MSTTIHATIHQNAVAPYALVYDVTTTSADFDLTEVSSARFDFRRRGTGTENTWTATVSDKTTTTCKLTYVFQSGDLPNEELIDVEPHLTLPSGELVAETRVIKVRAKFAL